VSTQCKFDFLKSKDVEVRFDEGPISTDAGLSVLIEWLDNQANLNRYAEVLEARDERDPSRTIHSNKQLLRQRLLQIIAGYEDANDCDRLRKDPLFKAANDRLEEDEANASQPTMSRLETRVSAKEVVIFNKQLLEGYIEEKRDDAPEEIILDIDATPAEAHGEQQQALFDGYYGQRIYFPLVVCDGKTGELLAVRLRNGRAHDKHRARPTVRRIVDRLREEFPETEIRLRADDGFTGVKLYRMLDDREVSWRINYAANEVLKRRTEDTLEEVQQEYEETGKKVVRFELLEGYQANTWNKSRWVAAKIECGPQGTNRRFVVCSERPESAQGVFEFYEGRGICEQYIREFKDGYRGEKMSCSSFVANAFRAVLYGLAYTLVVRFRREHLSGTELEGAFIQTIREKLFKLGARIKITARRFWIHASQDWPYQELFERVARSVCPQPG